MAAAPERVVVLLQENKTTDFYFPSLVHWGADVATGGPLLDAPPDHDQPHDRNAWVHYRMGDYPALAAQIDDEVVVPFYSWLAKEHTFADHHVGLGTNSTPGHMLAVGGQTPTLRNPPFTGAHPTWNLPTIFTHAERAGIDWAAFPDGDGYPTKLYAELATPARTAHVHCSDDFFTMTAAGTLPRLCYLWSPAGSDEHPPHASDPAYVMRGHDLTWRRVDAVVAAGEWANTTFILTWDDWGGYADHVVTPAVETVPDALHPHGFPILAGSRIPLLMFGGHVRQGIDNRWHSHASIVTTIVDLLGLPPFGVPRVDGAPSLADLVEPGLTRAEPPRHGTTVVQPAPPIPPPAPVPPGPWPGPLGLPMPPLVAADGSTLPAPHDAVVRRTPPPPPVP